MRKYNGARFVLGAALAAIAIAALVSYAGIRRGNWTHASPAPELLSLVPAGAPTLIYIDLAAIRASSFYQHRPDTAPITVPDPNYASFVQATGFDFEKDLDRVVIASWPQAVAQEKKKTVAIAEGRFDHQKIHDYALKKGKLDQQRGREVFLFPASDRADWNSLEFLDDHRLVIAEGSDVSAALGPPVGDSSADPMRERAARMSGAALFAITRVPEFPANFGAGGAQSAQLASLARAVQWITLAAQPEGDLVRISLDGECKTSADARQIQSALEILRMFGSAALEDPKSRPAMDPNALRIAETMLKSAEVSATAEHVRIRLEIGPDILKWNSPPGGHIATGSPATGSH